VKPSLEKPRRRRTGKATSRARNSGKKQLRPAAVQARPAVRPPGEDAKASALAHRIAALALDKKADEVVILDVRGKTSYADYFLIASGESERQVNAIAEHVEAELKNDGVRPLGIEGRERGPWVLLDFGDVVAHFFFGEVRGFYDLEGLWTDAPRERVA
jgi:ribosome-associated protein